MYSKVNTCVLQGLNGSIVEVESDLSRGLPVFNIVGLPDASIKESKERVRAAIKNSGFEFPLSRITINLAPANLKKEGSQIQQLRPRTRRRIHVSKNSRKCTAHSAKSIRLLFVCITKRNYFLSFAKSLLILAVLIWLGLGLLTFNQNASFQ